ncbi:hypothetical protein FRC11_008804 [Ceratobasidium sp. 423]|nr:hypothetical protein FRC11_008804 [Ceratobasidium sp. 423]
MENPLPPPPLIASPPLASPGPVPIPNGHRESKRNGTREFPITDPGDERPEHRGEPPKGNSFVRKVRSSLLGGKNPFASQNKAAERERERQEQIVIPPPLSPEPDAVIVGRPGLESNGTTPEPPALPKGPRGSRPPVTTYSTKLYSGQSAQPTQSSRPRGGSFSSTTHSQHSASEPVKTDRPPSRNKSRSSREVQIVVVSSKKIEDAPLEREPVLGATTPSLSSSTKTHASQPTSDTPPKGMERTPWASAPQSRHAAAGHTRAATVDQLNASDAWADATQRLALRNGHQQGYHMEMSSKYESPPRSLPPSTQPQPQPPPKSKPHKLQRHATTAVSTPSTVVTHYYYDPSPPLITRIDRLSELKEDYRNPGSERSTIIRRKINYLRFELGYTGLRRARGDGNCFYRSFAFSYLEQIIFAEDRAVAVVSALDYLEVAQNLLEAAMPDNKFSKQMHLFMRDLIRNIELGKTDQRRLLKTFQDPRDSDDIVAYVRLLASAYIRLTPEMHASVFHPDDPGVVISPIDFCVYFVEEMNQDADHLQISALSRTLNVAVHIYRLDEKIDGIAPNDQDIPAHCTRFTPTDAPTLTEPVALLFRPGHYDILERHTEYP